MFHVTVTTTTPPVTVLSSTSTTTMTVMMAPSPIALTVVSGHDVVLPPPLILRDTMKGAADFATVLLQQQSQSQMPSQAYANYAMGPF